ncbi:UDP-N-acetylmuramoyl-L-alanine--D-glutamate ligase [Pleionea sp. CnH1-48]|uniref:UDP-N-acetylmuramoyl-L-alanine--D-glutamate ligase n=1 Tax=Pleionea sp. CnH1-48 TaxID=2954494 RepID=UPI0020983CF5|nr:UDP-N-acetylmuramoyl-L-alanine--D-glutamate ligase [Pleionea sp. CnH1-48]MCO7223994.1 UDP-N-acetylmuramoyl-L-alanine--D-glutamate ligase [Pleionea sp. CnH1-48]
MFEAITQKNPVMIVGLGLTGMACARYCQRKQLPFLMLDTREKPPAALEFIETFGAEQLKLGGLDQTVISTAGLIVVSPGVDLNTPALIAAKEQGISIVGDIELFVDECSTPIVAITGSNGKSTVCDALGYALNRSGIKTLVAGNIGTPVLDLLLQPQPELYVFELSSFQLESTYSLKAKVAVVLNVSEDHLDRHHTVENYAAIKRRIYRNAEHAIYNIEDSATHPQDVSGQVTSVGLTEDSDWHVHSGVDGFEIQQKGKPFLSENDTLLKGAHNGYNFAVCIAVADALGISELKTFCLHLASYAGLEHRCQRVLTEDGIVWINDSKATNPGAAEAAIKSFRSQKHALYLIAGGDVKGADIDELAELIQKNVSQCWVFGKDAGLFSHLLPETLCRQVTNMEQAVTAAKEAANEGDYVLLSPACASIDMYKNYQQRGEHFVSLVQGGKA